MSLIDLSSLDGAIQSARPFAIQGRVTRVVGLLIEATLPGATIGMTCEVEVDAAEPLLAEVVGFEDKRALLMPAGDLQGVKEGAKVTPGERGSQVPAGSTFLGRIFDASMRPIDGRPAPIPDGQAPLYAMPPEPMTRRRIHDVIPTGVRSLDACLTLGEGQRIGIFAGPGVGKSVLLGMLARSTEADVVVVGLIGERGREVREFIERDLGPEGLARSVVVVATGDASPLLRVRAAMCATAMAEYFRALGKKVLLLMDSLTRVAMAQREVGLAAGEPPTTKGYPPSVFGLLPRVLERAGNDQGAGSITGIYTVLVEGDDLSDPVADSARSLLDGHVVLSRRLAGSGHFPAVDVLSSVSRVMTEVASAPHQELARKAREVLATYEDSRDLVEVGAYVAGSNPKLDQALTVLPKLNEFLRQTPAERFSLDIMMQQLQAALEPEASRG